MIIAEAFACGTPVFCSKIGALEEIVSDQRTGLHFTPGDVDDLASKIKWSAAHPREVAAMGKAARLEYETHYTAEQNYRRLMQIYSQFVCAPSLN